MKETDAKYTLTDPTEVMAFLTLLLDWGSTSANAWHSHSSCTGWSPKQQAPPPPPQAQTSTPLGSLECKQNGHMLGSTTSDHAQDHGDDLQDDLQHPAGQYLHGCKGGDDVQTSPKEEVMQEGAVLSNSSPPSPGHSPTAFARVRQFHGLPASSDRAMPASQWLTKPDAPAPAKLETAAPMAQATHAQAQAESGPESRCESPAAAQAAGQEAVDEYRRMVGRDATGYRQTRRPSRDVCVKLMEAQGRPPTSKDVEQASNGGEAREEEASPPPSRPSLDHYLGQPYKAAEDSESGEAGHMGRWDSGEGVMPEKEVVRYSNSTDALQGARSSGEHSMASMPPYHNTGHPGQRLPEGKRLTALLLDKLQGHDAQRATGDEALSPPGLSSNSTSSMAGYQSPFESLAHEALSASEDTESIIAEIGSVASINLAPSR